MELRPPLETFARLMEFRLQANDHKVGWDGMRVDDLIDAAGHRLGQAWAAYRDVERYSRMKETGELVERDQEHYEKWRDSQIHELTDAANFLMMAVDRLADGAEE